LFAPIGWRETETLVSLSRKTSQTLEIFLHRAGQLRTLQISGKVVNKTTCSLYRGFALCDEVTTSTIKDFCASFLSDAISMVSPLAARITRRRRRRLHNNVLGFLRPGKAAKQNLGREAAGIQRHFDYFAGGIGPVIGEDDFERRFRMPIVNYKKLNNGVLEIDSYFSKRRDATGAQGTTTDQMLCTGTTGSLTASIRGFE
jgi:hypothetical protein